MSSTVTGRPAGSPSTMTPSARPWDSPAVRNRSMAARGRDGRSARQRRVPARAWSAAVDAGVRLGQRLEPLGRDLGAAARAAPVRARPVPLERPLRVAERLLGPLEEDAVGVLVLLDDGGIG